MSKISDFIDFAKFLREKVELGFRMPTTGTHKKYRKRNDSQKQYMDCAILYEWTPQDILDLNQQVMRYDYGGVLHEVEETILGKDDEDKEKRYWRKLLATLGNDTFFYVPEESFKEYGTESDRDLAVQTLFESINYNMRNMLDELKAIGEKYGLASKLSEPDAEADGLSETATVAPNAVAASVDSKVFTLRNDLKKDAFGKLVKLLQSQKMMNDYGSAQEDIKRLKDMFRYANFCELSGKRNTEYLINIVRKLVAVQEQEAWFESASLSIGSNAGNVSKHTDASNEDFGVKIKDIFNTKNLERNGK